LLGALHAMPALPEPLAFSPGLSPRGFQGGKEWSGHAHIVEQWKLFSVP